MPREPVRSAVPGLGLFKGMWLTLKTLFSKPATVFYPMEKEIPLPRARGVIALDIDACTVCMLCARECPDWCIYIEGHKEEQPPAKPGGGRAAGRCSTASTSTSPSACTAASASRCAPSTPSSGRRSTSTPERPIADLLHPKGRLSEWLETVPEPPGAGEGVES